MTHLDLLLPFSLPPPEIAFDLLKEIKAPALSLLLARAKQDAISTPAFGKDGFARALPHEAWLAGAFGLAAPNASDSSPAIAAALMQALGHAAVEGHWFVVQPVHLHAARDHLVLTDTRRLMLAEEEARTLFDIARAVFEEAGKTLICGNHATWFLRADEWDALRTATPDAATGHNIDIWMPRGPHEREWRKLQNEVQMLWFDDPVNRAREGAGLRPVNSAWLWGGADASAAPRTPAYPRVVNFSGWTQAAAARTEESVRAGSAPTALASKPSIALLDQLLEPALGNDWAGWLDAMHMLERDWFAPLLDSLKAGRADRISFILSDHVRLNRRSVSRNALRKFWIKPSLAALSS